MKTSAKDIRTEINTMADVYRLNGTSEEVFNKKWLGFTTHEIAEEKIMLIVLAYNEGKVQDYPYTYFAYEPLFISCPDRIFRYVRDIPGSFSCLSFFSLENMKDADKKFFPEYKQFYTS